MSNIVMNTMRPKTFSIGDKVKCVDARNQGATGLVGGQFYTVEWFDPGASNVYDLMKVYGLSEWYFADRFELAVMPVAVIEFEEAKDAVDPLIEQRRELKRLLGGI